MDERCSRFALLVGERVVRRLGELEVTIFGVGAVGTFVAEYLARSGARCFRLVDFDRIAVSNSNRLLTATTDTIGYSKADAVEARLHAIDPAIDVETKIEFAAAGSLTGLLPRPDPERVVIDCIDSLGPKLELLAASLGGGQNIVASMGAAGRLDPGAVRSGDLWASKGCHLAMRIRKGLRQRGLGDVPLPAVWSLEPAVAPLVPATPESGVEGENDEYYFERGRRRSFQPSCAWIPAVFAAELARMIVTYAATGKFSSQVADAGC